MNSKIAFLPLILSIVLSYGCQNIQTEASSKDSSDSPSNNLEWFNIAKFGMFIHWGLYAVPAGEWNGETSHAEWIMLQSDIPVDKYEAFATDFNPVKFDAMAWANLAKEAGMKYLVITAKHHDGFCMYDSKYTDYDIMDATPFKRDPLKELAEACRKTGIKFCVYYSIVDWHYPDFPQKYGQIRENFPEGYHGRPNPDADILKYNEYMRNQVRELLTNYGDVGIVWFDGGGSFRNYDRAALLEADEVVNTIREAQPEALINNRLGAGSDYGTPEQYIPEGAVGAAFEVCMTLNRHWGYNKYDNDWKDASTIIENISDIASKGGNYLLNVGPTSEGEIPDPSIRILKEVGEWMAVNGEAIYGTTAAPPRDNMRLGGGKMTQKPGKLYLHMLNWPEDGKIYLEGMKGNSVKKVYLLGDKQQTPLSYDKYERCINISVPDSAPDSVCSVVVVAYDGELLDKVGF